jgi:hypothetical protein
MEEEKNQMKRPAAERNGRRNEIICRERVSGLRIWLE